MKKILIVAASAGLLSLAACGGATNNTTENTTVEANVSDYDTNTVSNEVLPVENVTVEENTTGNTM
jgi:protein involved in sex pheromone biosynthesis